MVQPAYLNCRSNYEMFERPDAIFACGFLMRQNKNVSCWRKIA
jgi:hypothetical protein